MELARRLASAWLELALMSARVMIEPRFLAFADGRLGLGSSAFLELSPAMAANWWAYLQAVAMERSDAASTALTELAGWETSDPRVREFRRRMRWVVPHRDSAMEGSDLGSPGFGEVVRLHWRLCREQQLASSELDPFFSGLLSVWTLCRVLAPGRDVLREGLENVQWRASWEQVRRILTPQQMGTMAMSYVEGLVTLPESLRRATARSAETRSGESEPRGKSEEKERERIWNRVFASLVLLLLMGAAGWWSVRWTAWQGIGPWGDALAGLAFLAMGGLFLSWVGRGEGADRGGEAG